MEHETYEQEVFDWLESVEDGSLTLQAERLLFLLPEPLVPSFTTLYTPDLINIGVGTFTIDDLLLDDEGLDRLAKRFDTIVNHEDCFGLTDQTHVSRVKLELGVLCDWLRNQTKSSLQLAKFAA